MQRSAVPLVVIAIAAALVGLLAYGLVAAGDDTTLDDAVKRGERPTAPGASIARPLLDGSGSAKLADYRGKVVVLNFWASWCEPCLAEAPVLERAQQRLEKAGAGTVLGATYQDATKDSQDFERENGLSYPSIRDVDTELYEEFGGTGIPETFVIDGEGRVVALARGQVKQDFIDDALDKAGVPR